MLVLALCLVLKFVLRRRIILYELKSCNCCLHSNTCCCFVTFLVDYMLTIIYEAIADTAAISYLTIQPSPEVAPTTLASFSSRGRELWPMTLNPSLDADDTKMNRRAGYKGQRSFCSRSFVRTHRHTNIRRTDISTWTTKVVGINTCYNCLFEVRHRAKYKWTVVHSTAQNSSDNWFTAKWPLFS